MKFKDYQTKMIELKTHYDMARLEKAFLFGAAAHKGQLRKSGEAYFSHPLEVSLILAELEMDEDTVIAALLHDVVEDTDISLDELKKAFGSTVTMLVDGVTKLGKISYETKEERQAENLRKMFIAMAEDIRVILIKLADRLHNMRTLKFMSDDKKKEKAEETLEIYAPIANRLGIYRIKWELEDLCLLYIDPENYYSLVQRVSKKRDERENSLNLLMTDLKKNLNDVDIEVKISGRPKNFYSIYKKMVYQQKDFEEIFDLEAVRVIVDSVKDCYGALGIVHTMWKPIPGRFKDYIAMPKPNMYQSLHTTVLSGSGEPFEIQIRTWEMHRVAEFGIAAHWKYKEGISSADDKDDKLSWLRQMMEWQKDVKSPQEFMDSLKQELFTNQVYVLTPEGEVVELPMGSTPVDFAYKIHSGVGNACVGAKVDGRIVPLSFKLTNGRIVEIMTSKSSPGPSRDWLKFVKSTQAKNKIRHWFKKERREENIEKGKEMFERDVRRVGLQLKEVLKSDWLDPIMKRLTVKDVEDLYATIGYGGIMMNQIIPRLREKHREEQKKKQLVTQTELDLIKPREMVNKKKPKVSQGVEVKGIDNILIRFAKCCNPLPGDGIIGYITRGRGVTVHRADCANLESTEDSESRYIEVGWIVDDATSYNSEIQIIAPDRKGLLSEITILMSESNATVNGVNAKRSKTGIAVINLSVEITDISQLNRLINKFKNMPDVIEVKRVAT